MCMATYQDAEKVRLLRSPPCRSGFARQVASLASRSRRSGLKGSTSRSVDLVFSLTAVLLDSLFEPPEPATLLHNERSRFAGQGATDILGIGD
jgi:hypothetical protein